MVAVAQSLCSLSGLEGDAIAGRHFLMPSHRAARTDGPHVSGPVFQSAWQLRPGALVGTFLP